MSLLEYSTRRPKNWPGLITGFMRRFLLQRDHAHGFQNMDEYIFEEGADFMHAEVVKWLRSHGIFLKAAGYKINGDTADQDFFGIPINHWRDFTGETK